MESSKKIATRDGFGDEIVELGKENRDILVVDADIGKSCKTGAFRKALPEQYLNVGIAEQNCAGAAAGLATCGKIPFVVTYAAFGSMRMLEMIRQEICYPKLNVKISSLWPTACTPFATPRSQRTAPSASSAQAP